MAMDKKVRDLINDQINKEFFSAYLYLDIANFFASKGFDGFAHWYEVQAREEQEHAMKFYAYLHDNDEKVKLGAIDAPATAFKTFKAAVDAAYKHEQYVTDLINKIYEAADKAKDYRTKNFLGWFIDEQGEEEKNARDLVDKLALFGEEKQALYMLDRELSRRAE